MNRRKPRAFVYVEVQLSKSFGEYPWDKDNAEIGEQPGVISKTWLSGAANQSLGGFYALDSIGNAKKYATEFMAAKARKLGIGLTTRIFDAEVVTEASKEMSSPFFA